MVRCARALYKRTRSPTLRRLYFQTFSAVVRRRTVRSTIDGLTFELQLGELIDLAVFLQQYEPDVTAALETHCRPGMIVLDIGANVGAHTLRMAKAVGSGGAVYAFEPTDFAFTKLVRNVSLNPFTQVFPVKVALSSENVRDQTIHYRSSWRTDGTRSDASSLVDFVRLDDWGQSAGIDSVSLMKIDVDGNEYGVLAGGLGLLERCRPTIVMEAVWPHFSNPKTNPFALLSRLGYEFVDTQTGRRYLLDDLAARFPNADPEMTSSFNVVASVPSTIAAPTRHAAP